MALIGSSGSLEGIRKVIGQFYYSPNIKLVECSHHEGAHWDVHNSKGKISGVWVIKKGKRFIFEDTMKNNPLYQTSRQINAALRLPWEFHFHNVNKETKEQSRSQKIIIVVSAINPKTEMYYPVDRMRKAAVKKFTQIVNTMYPKADQIVEKYGYINNLRIFA